MDVLALRRKLKMTQRELAAALGTYQRTISAWETEAGRHPVGATRTLLVLLDRDPTVILPLLLQISVECPDNRQH